MDREPYSEEPFPIEAVTEDEIGLVVQKRAGVVVEGPVAAAVVVEYHKARRVAVPGSGVTTQEKQHWFGRQLVFLNERK